jgi:hypothetical protein
METEYEYGVQRCRKDTNTPAWRMASTNHFDGWYPSEKSMKNALAQLRAVRWGREPFYQYRGVRRPVGEIEVLSG